MKSRILALVFAVIALVFGLPAVAQDAIAKDKKPAVATADKVVVATMEVGSPPKPGDEAWKDWVHKDFVLDLTKGDTYFGVRVRGGSKPTDFTDLQVKVTRGPDQKVIRNGKPTTIPGKPEMKAMLPGEEQDPSNVKAGSEVRRRWAPEPLPGLTESAKGGLALWVSTTNPDAPPEGRHPILACVEMVIAKDGSVECFRIWRHQPRMVMDATPSEGGTEATPEPPRTVQPDPPEREEWDTD